jgi:hypothetical protein
MRRSPRQRDIRYRANAAALVGPGSGICQRSFFVGLAAAFAQGAVPAAVVPSKAW